MYNWNQAMKFRPFRYFIGGSRDLTKVAVKRPGPPQPEYRFHVLRELPQVSQHEDMAVDSVEPACAKEIYRLVGETMHGYIYEYVRTEK